MGAVASRQLSGPGFEPWTDIELMCTKRFTFARSAAAMTLAVSFGALSSSPCARWTIASQPSRAFTMVSTFVRSPGIISESSRAMRVAWV